MGVMLNSDTVEVFKFPETGIVALCQEVTEFVASGQAALYGLDVSLADFEVDPRHGYLKVVFPR